MGKLSGLRVWLSGPGRLVRSPWIAIPLFLIAGLGGPLLVLDQSVIQAAGNASLATDLEVCPFNVGLSVVRDVPVPGAVGVPGQPAPRTLDQVTAALDKVVGASAEDRVITLFGGTVSLVDPATGKKVPVQLISRTNAAAHVVPANAPGSSGLLVQKMVLPQLGVDHPVPVQLVDGNHTVSLPIVAVITDLSSGVDPSYWCSLNPQIYGSDRGSDRVSEAPLAIVDQANLLAVVSQLHHTTITAAWEYPPSPANWNIATATRTLARYRAIGKDGANPDGQIVTEIGEGPTPTSDQTNTLGTARQQQTAAQGAIRPFTSGALLTLLIALAICAASWLEVGRPSRRTLVRHGLGVPGVALKSVLELFPPVVGGFVLGVVGSWLVARWKLPGDAHSWLTGVSTTDRIVVGLVVPLVVIVAASIIDAVGVVRPRAQRRVWLFPAGLFAAVVAAGFSIYTYHQRVETSRLHHSLLGSDILSAVAAVAVTAVISVVLVRMFISAPASRLADRLSSSIWLAWRRVCSDRSIRTTLAGVALAMAMLYFVSANISAVAQSAETRRTIQVGAANAYVLSEPPTPAALARLPIGVTVVTKLPESSVLTVGKAPLVVLGVDPSTFSQQAYWRDTFSDDSLQHLLAKLDDPSDPLAAIVVGNDVPSRFQATLPGESGDVALHLHTVGHARFFPGEDTVGQRSLVIVNRATLLGAGITTGVQLWSASSKLVTVEQLTADGFAVTRTDRASAEPLDGVQATTAALSDGRRISIVALLAAVLASFAWTASRHRKNARELRLIQMMGLSRRGLVIVVVLQGLIAGALILLTALVAGEVANRLLPGFVDQSPFVDPPTERVFVAAPWLLGGAGLMIVLAGSAAVTWSRIARNRGYEELVRDG